MVYNNGIDHYLLKTKGLKLTFFALKEHGTEFHKYTCDVSTTNFRGGLACCVTTHGGSGLLMNPGGM